MTSLNIKFLHYTRSKSSTILEGILPVHCTIPSNKGCHLFLPFHSFINSLPTDFLLSDVQNITMELQTSQRVSLSVEEKACIIGMKVTGSKMPGIATEMGVLAQLI